MSSGGNNLLLLSSSPLGCSYENDLTLHDIQVSWGNVHSSPVCSISPAFKGPDLFRITHKWRFRTCFWFDPVSPPLHARHFINFFMGSLFQGLKKNSSKCYLPTFAYRTLTDANDWLVSTWLTGAMQRTDLFRLSSQFRLVRELVRNCTEKKTASLMRINNRPECLE